MLFSSMSHAFIALAKILDLKIVYISVKDSNSPWRSGFRLSWASECQPQRCIQGDRRWIGQCSHSDQCETKWKLFIGGTQKTQRAFSISSNFFFFLLDCVCASVFVHWPWWARWLRPRAEAAGWLCGCGPAELPGVGECIRSRERHTQTRSGKGRKHQSI